MDSQNFTIFYLCGYRDCIKNMRMVIEDRDRRINPYEAGSYQAQQWEDGYIEAYTDYLEI